MIYHLKGSRFYINKTQLRTFFFYSFLWRKILILLIGTLINTYMAMGMVCQLVTWTDGKRKSVHISFDISLCVSNWIRLYGKNVSTSSSMWVTRTVYISFQLFRLMETPQLLIFNRSSKQFPSISSIILMFNTQFCTSFLPGE